MRNRQSAKKSRKPRETIGEGGIGVTTHVGAVDAEKKPVKKIGEEEVKTAAEALKKYKAGKASLDERIISNNEWYKLRHWGELRKKKAQGKEPEPASAWLFSVLNNKHADAMDNIPELSVLPREASDDEEAKTLSSIMPVIFEACGFPQVYSDMWWQKLKTGTGVLGIFWNPGKNNGLGDIDVRPIDILNLYWEPGVKDLQDSEHLFSVQLVNNSELEAEYPELRGELTTNDQDVKAYAHDDTIDTSQKSAVVDWYYKKTLPNRKQVLHYCKYTGNHVLYASENDPLCAERGFYDHGMYPFVFDTMFPEEGSPAGFGYLDICKDSQTQIDKLNQAILMVSLMAAKPRWFSRGDGNINEEEFADWTKPFVHYHGNSNPKECMLPITPPQMDPLCMNFLEGKINELKEVSGNRDFSQGGTTAGVTAASAIAALQEAGNKLSRDMISSSYRAFERTGQIVIELIRQFYTQPRCFRIVGDDGMEFATYDNSNIAMQPQYSETGMDLGMRKPVFDIKVKSQKRSPFSTAVENERAAQLFNQGFFNADRAEDAISCLEMMTFEGKDKLIQRLQERSMERAQMQMLMERMDQLTRIIDAQNGTTLNSAATAEMQPAGTDQVSTGSPRQMAAETTPNQLGAAVINRRSSPDGAARTQAAAAAAPRI